MKLIAVFSIFVGEAVAISAELMQARQGKHGIAARDLAALLGVFLVSGVLLLVGYGLGYRSFEKIWIVSIASMASILVAEPILNYVFFRELPERGTLIAFPLIVIAFIISVIYR